MVWGRSGRSVGGPGGPGLSQVPKVDPKVQKMILKLGLSAGLFLRLRGIAEFQRRKPRRDQAKNATRLGLQWTGFEPTMNDNTPECAERVDLQSTG